MDCFVKLNKDILKTKDSKFIMVNILLNQYIDRIGRCKFDLNELITDCGFKVTKGKGKSIDKFKNIIKYLIDNNIMKECSIKNINNININTHIKCIYEPIFDKNKEGNDSNFIKFPIDLLNNILKITTKDRCDTIFILSYLLSFMNDNQRFCYPSLDNIVEVTGLSKPYIKKILEKLKENNLEYVDNIGLCSKNGEFKNFNNVYAFNRHDLEEGLLASKSYAKAQGYIILNKRQKEIAKQINGLKGIIVKLRHEGKDVEEYKEKLKQLKKKIKDECKVSVDDLNKRIDELNDRCDELGIDGVEPSDSFNIDELKYVIKYLKNKINNIDNK